MSTFKKLQHCMPSEDQAAANYDKAVARAALLRDKLRKLQAQRRKVEAQQKLLVARLRETMAKLSATEELWER